MLMVDEPKDAMDAITYQLNSSGSDTEGQRRAAHTVRNAIFRRRKLYVVSLPPRVSYSTHHTAKQGPDSPSNRVQKTRGKQ